MSGLQDMIEVGALKVRFVVEPEDSNGSVSVFECFVPAHAKMPAPHSHGALRRPSTGSRGSRPGRWTGRLRRSAWATRCALRAVRSTASTTVRAQDAKFLAISSPGVMRPDYFREVGAVLAASAERRPNPARIGEVMRRYGLTPAPPSTA